jgi:hypothetical protein
MDEPGAEPDSARNALQPRVRSAGGWSPFTFAAISLVALGLAAWSSPAGKRRWHGPARLEAQPQELTIMAEPGRPRDQVVTCRVKNVGGEALMIQRATACCGSKLISDPAGQRVGPQQTIAFHARVTLPTPGQMNRTAIDVLTDAPSSPLIRCELKLLGEPLATPRCILAPDRVYLARRTGHDPQSEFILETIEEAHSQPWITAMSASDPAVSVTKLDVQVARNLVGGALVRRYRWLAVCAPSATRQDIRGTLAAR